MTKIIAVAILYYLTGQLGLLLAVPPGYATVIWPASGIALGALLAFGGALWPGIFIGSFVLNSVIGGAYSAETGLVYEKLAVAAAIAGGSTAQALVARWLIGRSVGMPIDLKGIRDALTLFVVAAPVSCVVAASVGVASLYIAGVVPIAGIAHNWLTWWTGDVLGILIFLPIVLIAPGAKHQLTWRGSHLGALPIAAILLLLLPLGLTFYGWKATSQFIYDRNKAIFASIVIENEQALIHRVASYDQALLGGVGFFEGSNYVSAEEWRSYVKVLDLESSMPGVSGIGYIAKVEPEMVSDFLLQAQTGTPAFAIHPDVPNGPRFIITYIEPLVPNRPALGLNVAFEANRLEGATLSRDTGKPAITKRIVLVQDKTKSSGFMLLHPMYRRNVPLDTVDQRRAALIGWIYAPFVAQKFMSGLTPSEGRSLTLQVYDGDEEQSNALIYQGGEPESASVPAFSVRKHLDVLQQRWTLSWHSTPAFERSVASGEPFLVLAGGIVFTALFGILLLLFARRAETVRVLVDRKTRELAEREALYRLLAENTSDMISRVALDGTRLYVSPACLRLIGYTPEELQRTNALSDVHPQHRPRLQAEYAKLALGEIDESKGVFPLHRKDGGWVQAEVTLQLVRDHSTGSPAELVVTKRDVTLQEQRSEELTLAKAEAESARANAEQANEAKTVFLATMSHEIRTPLNGVIGYGDLLLESKDLSEVNRRYAERIGTSASALLTVVNDILDFSRIEAGQIEIDVHPFALGALVDNVLSIVGGLAAHKGLVLAKEVDSTLPTHLLGDQDRLRQILLNLLNNAVKFTAKGSILLTVDRVDSAGGESDFLRFAVRDTGIGISAEQQGRLFQRFSQVDGSIRREFGGSGLGLAISKRLVELMGGRIGIDSEIGVGSMFWFEVALPEADMKDTPAGDSGTTDGRRLSARILLVEDMEINQDIACAVLRVGGHEVDVVSDGAQAVAAVQNRAYDIVLMDVQMPVMDGLTATRYIRALDGPVRDLPIVALTANVLPFQLAELRAAGMSDHVGKPFRRDELLAAIDRNVDGGADRHGAAPDQPAGCAFDSVVYNQLEEMLGTNRVHQLLDKLASILRTRLVGTFSDAVERDAVQRDAHSLVSSSGMLGFETLSNLCREIETSCVAGVDPAPVLRRFEVARDAVLEKIEALKSAA